MKPRIGSIVHVYERYGEALGDHGPYPAIVSFVSQGCSLSSISVFLFDEDEGRTHHEQSVPMLKSFADILDISDNVTFRWEWPPQEEGPSVEDLKAMGDRHAPDDLKIKPGIASIQKLRQRFVSEEQAKMIPPSGIKAVAAPFVNNVIEERTPPGHDGVIRTESTRRVIIESPFRGDTKEEEERNVRYARACMLDCLVERRESPIASHLLYTQVLDDSKDWERQTGIMAGLAWQQVADAVVFYVDLGMSAGMQKAMDLIAQRRRHGMSVPPVEVRSLGLGWDIEWSGQHDM